MSAEEKKKGRRDTDSLHSLLSAVIAQFKYALGVLLEGQIDSEAMSLVMAQYSEKLQKLDVERATADELLAVAAREVPNEATST